VFARRATKEKADMSQMLVWICLVLVAPTTAHGLQLTAAALVPSAAGLHCCTT
jgi:hypothetical protein